ncbi:MAG TPA: hypothetical protein VNW71_13235 [Thermoanaerobaculia bacterium]|nr:hypothetical protein [Thermoanaerobaculia bacterium]
MRAALVRARRRRRLLAGFTSLVLLFSAAMGLQMRRTAREAARANREAETARRVSEFLVGLFEVRTPMSRSATPSPPASSSTREPAGSRPSCATSRRSRRR